MPFSPGKRLSGIIFCRCGEIQPRGETEFNRAVGGCLRSEVKKADGVVEDTVGAGYNDFIRPDGSLFRKIATIGNCLFFAFDRM